MRAMLTRTSPVLLAVTFPPCTHIQTITPPFASTTSQTSASEGRRRPPTASAPGAGWAESTAAIASHSGLHFLWIGCEAGGIRLVLLAPYKAGHTYFDA